MYVNLYVWWKKNYMVLGNVLRMIYVRGIFLNVKISVICSEK